MEHTDPYDTKIPTDIVQDIDETAQERLITSRDTIPIVWNDSERTHTIFLTAHSRQLVFALKIDVHVAGINIHLLIHPYSKFHVLDVAAHSIR